jgi:hypothetical protein
MLRENSIAAKALFTLVRMPQDKHGSRKAIKHWRGSQQLSPRPESTIGQPGLSGSKVRVARCRGVERKRALG